MKNIVICSDGTWQSPESDTSTHVLRLAEGIAPEDSTGNKQVVFHDTEPSRIINHARHAVTIDENRQDFEPTLWSPKAGIDLQQVWFAGVHTDIGGGYPDHALGDIPGEWMAREVQACG